MPIELIDKIKPKNGGTFPLMDAADVEMPDGTRLDQIAGTIKDENSGATIRVWFGSEKALEALEAAGLIEDDVLYNAFENDDEVST